MEQRNVGGRNGLAPLPVALTVAGSDSGGGAGVQADLRTFTANGVFGTSAITAITCQNPTAVERVDGLPGDAVIGQIRAVLKVFNVRAIKTGMLFSADIIEAVAAEISGVKCPLVVDPVMVSTSGAKLLKDDALQMLQDKILPIADWITPNMPEAELLSGMKICDLNDAKRAASFIAEKWDTGVVLKGGHADGDTEAADVICTGDKMFKLATPRLQLPPYAAHGTGCTFSSALAAALAKGESDTEALISAKAYVLGALAEARSLGRSGVDLYGMFPPADLTAYKHRILIGKL